MITAAGAAAGAAADAADVGTGAAADDGSLTTLCALSGLAISAARITSACPPDTTPLGSFGLLGSKEVPVFVVKYPSPALIPGGFLST